MSAARVVVVALLALVLTPIASAASASVLLEGTEGAWNGLSQATPDAGATSVLVWVPPDARIQSVTTSSENASAPATWRAAGASALLVPLPDGASSASVAFDTRASATRIARYVAPSALAELTIVVQPGAGLLVESPDAVVLASSSGLFTLHARDVGAGDAFALRAVDADRVGELPILASVLLLAVLVLAGTFVYHRARPPLAGREPQGLLDHLQELQARLVPPVIVFALANVFYFIAGLRILKFDGRSLIVPSFGTGGSLASRAFASFSERLVPPEVGLVVLGPVDAILAQVQMTLFLAFVTVLPLILYELAVFIGPALSPRERRMALAVIPLVAGLFVVGALLGYLVMAPLMIGVLYSYAPSLGATPLLVVGDLVSFALILMVSFGLAFELPVVMFVLSRVGVVKAATFGKYFRHAVVAIFLLAGIITPDPSVVSQSLVALPVTALYLIGMGAAKVAERRRAAARPA